MFERHFGFGFDRLVDRWREWVQEQGIGTFARPLSHIEDGLLNRLIPLAENRQANTDDRILAIRDMGSKGYVLGADALIGLYCGVMTPCRGSRSFGPWKQSPTWLMVMTRIGGQHGGTGFPPKSASGIDRMWPSPAIRTL